MEVIGFDTPDLGDRSYLVSDGFTGLVIDPQRDVDRILETVDEQGIEITHVLETHIHNDYVSGGLELARTTGATYVVPALDDVGFERLGVADGDEFSAEAMMVRAIHTPGHTRNHFSYAVGEGGGWEALFSGGSMLLGTTGRTDLLGPELTEDLTRAQYHSVRRLAAELPPQTHVHPTHGFGSFCSAASAAQGNSTVATEISRNPALTLSEDAFVKELLDSLDAFPTYYAYMAPINRAGPEPLDLSPPAEVDVAELISRIKAGEWVVDLRPRKAFAGAHLRGSLSFELNTRFTSYLGWALPWGVPVTLLGNSEEDVARSPALDGSHRHRSSGRSVHR
jgi:hydroxyacylglutathione hydrolase